MIQRSARPVFCKQSPVEASPPLLSSSPPSRLLSPPSSSVLRLHSSVVWRCIDNTPLFFFFFFKFLPNAGLYSQCFNVTPRKPLDKMELPNKLRWDQFLILATALMSPALTWVHLRAPDELMLHAGSGYLEFGRSWGKLLSMTAWFLRIFNLSS